MQVQDREERQRELDAMLLVFRAARRAGGVPEGWLRAMRQAVGIPAGELARRLGVSKREVFRMERAETESKIMLRTLREAAGALGCELIYALVPAEGTVERLGELQQEWRKKQREEREELRHPRISGRAAMGKAVRRLFRSLGVRLR